LSLKEFRLLQQAVAPIPIGWSKSEEVRTALAIRLAAQIEHDSGNDQLQSAAERATKQLQIAVSGCGWAFSSFASLKTFAILALQNPVTVVVRD
jgi:hypothetical protein